MLPDVLHSFFFFIDMNITFGGTYTRDNGKSTVRRKKKNKQFFSSSVNSRAIQDP